MCFQESKYQYRSQSQHGDSESLKSNSITVNYFLLILMCSDCAKVRILFIYSIQHNRKVNLQCCVTVDFVSSLGSRPNEYFMATRNPIIELPPKLII